MIVIIFCRSTFLPGRLCIHADTWIAVSPLQIFATAGLGTKPNNGSSRSQCRISYKPLSFHGFKTVPQVSSPVGLFFNGKKARLGCIHSFFYSKNRYLLEFNLSV